MSINTEREIITRRNILKLLIVGVLNILLKWNRPSILKADTLPTEADYKNYFEGRRAIKERIGLFNRRKALERYGFEFERKLANYKPLLNCILENVRGIKELITIFSIPFDLDIHPSEYKKCTIKKVNTSFDLIALALYHGLYLKNDVENNSFKRYSIRKNLKTSQYLI